jgi:hypothetical protein
MPELAEWDTFYVIVGSAAAALIGLQFIVITLIAERLPLRAADLGAAFATPNIVHFCGALLVSALLRAPWHSMRFVAVLLGLTGLTGLAYSVMVTWRLRKQTIYKPQFEDWLFNVVLPLLAYLVLALSPFAVFSHLRGALFGVGAAALLLVFIGIHNTWDAISYHVFVNREEAKIEPRRDNAHKKKAR